MKNENRTIDRKPKLLNDCNIVCRILLNPATFFIALRGLNRRNALSDCNCPIWFWLEFDKPKLKLIWYLNKLESIQLK